MKVTQNSPQMQDFFGWILFISDKHNSIASSQLHGAFEAQNGKCIDHYDAGMSFGEMAMLGLAPFTFGVRSCSGLTSIQNASWPAEWYFYTIDISYAFFVQSCIFVQTSTKTSQFSIYLFHQFHLKRETSQAGGGSQKKRREGPKTPCWELPWGLMQSNPATVRAVTQCKTLAVCLGWKDGIQVEDARWYPQIIHFNRVFHYKPSNLGHPCLDILLGGGNSNMFYFHP